MPSAPVVTFYTRPDCHLCDRAREQLEALRDGGRAFEIRELDVDSDRALAARYGERVPVVELDGEVVSELGMDVDGLRARLDTVSP